MKRLPGPRRDTIRADLAAQRRGVILEDLSLALVYLILAVALTLFAWILTFMFFSYVFYGGAARSHAPLRENAVRFSTVAWLSCGLLFLLAWLKRDYVIGEKPSGRPQGIFTDLNLYSPAELVREYSIGLFLSGPRCAMLAWQYIHFAWQLSRQDLDHLARIFDDALHRRKTHQQHLHIPITEFLEDTNWIKGIVPLHRPPGFFFSEDLRKQWTGYADAPRSQQQPPPEQPIDDLDEELRWALLLLGLKRNATRREIQTAYRTLAKQVHPDSHQDASARREAEEKMKDLNLAYEILRRRR